MKQKLSIFLSSAFLALSCGPKGDCSFNGIKVDCALMQPFEKLTEQNNLIEKSLQNDSMSIDEKIALREAFLTQYQKNKDTLHLFVNNYKSELQAKFPNAALLSLDGLVNYRASELEALKQDKVNERIYKALSNKLILEPKVLSNVKIGKSNYPKGIELGIDNQTDSCFSYIDLYIDYYNEKGELLLNNPYGIEVRYSKEFFTPAIKGDSVAPGYKGKFLFDAFPDERVSKELHRVEVRLKSMAFDTSK